MRHLGFACKRAPSIRYRRRRRGGTYNPQATEISTRACACAGDEAVWRGGSRCAESTCRELLKLTAARPIIHARRSARHVTRSTSNRGRTRPRRPREELRHRRIRRAPVSPVFSTMRGALSSADRFRASAGRHLSRRRTAPTMIASDPAGIDHRVALHDRRRQFSRWISRRTDTDPRLQEFPRWQTRFSGVLHVRFIRIFDADPAARNEGQCFRGVTIIAPEAASECAPARADDMCTVISAHDIIHGLLAALGLAARSAPSRAGAQRLGVTSARGGADEPFVMYHNNLAAGGRPIEGRDGFKPDRPSVSACAAHHPQSRSL